MLVEDYVGEIPLWEKIMDRKVSVCCVPSASSPFAVFTMFLVSTTSVRLFSWSILQMPRVTPPLSDRVFFGQENVRKPILSYKYLLKVMEDGTIYKKYKRKIVRCGFGRAIWERLFLCCVKNCRKSWI